jgi:hypothetical protein
MLRLVALVRTDVAEECILHQGDKNRQAKDNVSSNKRSTLQRRTRKPQPWKPQILHSIIRLGSVAEA